MSVQLSNRKILAGFIVLITVITVNQWSVMPIGNTYTDWTLYALSFFIIFRLQKDYRLQINNQYFTPIYIYLIWVTICIVRGFFAAEFYWDFKNLISAGFTLLLVCTLFVFTHPALTWQVLRTWIKYALPLFGIIILFISTESYGYYLVPISFFSLFYPSLTPKWKFIIIGISLLVIFVDFDARSNVIKFMVPLLFSFLIFFEKFLHSKYYKLLFKIMFIAPILLLVLGISDIFNIFKMDDYITGTYKETKVMDGELRDVSLTADTRTFLYKEVILSAINNDYVLFGRTPARGNDSEYFGTHAAEELGTKRYERYGNEVSMLNIFTWIGLIGVILYTWIFYKAVDLAITQSNNHYLKIIGIYLAFRYMYAWVEDFSRFDINNVMLWLMISMCYSVQFRKMTDYAFKNWIHSVLNLKILKIV